MGRVRQKRTTAAAASNGTARKGGHAPKVVAMATTVAERANEDIGRQVYAPLARASVASPSSALSLSSPATARAPWSLCLELEVLLPPSSSVRRRNDDDVEDASEPPPPPQEARCVLELGSESCQWCSLPSQETTVVVFLCEQTAELRVRPRHVRVDYRGVSACSLSFGEGGEGEHVPPLYQRCARATQMEALVKVTTTQAADAWPWTVEFHANTQELRALCANIDSMLLAVGI